MSGVETTFRGTVQALCATVVVPLALLVATWGSPASASATRAAATQPASCASPGQVYSANVIVEHKNGKVELKTLFLVCKPDHFVKIVDSDGHAYDDLNDFRAHNHLFSEDDKITVPRAFPSVDAKGSPGFGPTVSGHTGTSSVWWWLIGGFTLIPIIGGGLLWLVARRRRAEALAFTTDSPEPSP